MIPLSWGVRVTIAKSVSLSRTLQKATNESFSRSQWRTFGESTTGVSIGRRTESEPFRSLSDTDAKALRAVAEGLKA